MAAPNVENVILDNKTINQPVADETARDAIPTDNLTIGTLVYQVDPGAFYVWSGSAWQPLGVIDGNLMVNGSVDATNLITNFGTVTNTFSGIWAAAQNGNIYWNAVNGTVCITLPPIAAAANTASFISSTAAIPLNYRPVADQSFPLIIQDNGNITPSPGKIIIRSTGIINIYASQAGGNFLGISVGGNSGFPSTSITYNISAP
jgi:hypothetical protein